MSPFGDMKTVMKNGGQMKPPLQPPMLHPLQQHLRLRSTMAAKEKEKARKGKARASSLSVLNVPAAAANSTALKIVL